LPAHWLCARHYTPGSRISGFQYSALGGPLAPETALLHQADLVVGIGIRHNEVLAARPFSCPAVNIDPLGETHSFGFKFQYTAPGADPQLETLFEQLSEKAWGLDPLQRCLASLRARMLTADFLPANVYVALAAHFKNKARLVLDTGNFCTIGEHAWDVPSPGLYLASGQGRYMGVGLPLALGAALYDASVPTVVFCGDGGIGMFVAEIKIAVQHCLPLIVVLMSDGHLGTIRGGAIQKHLTQQPAFIARPSWLDAFEGLGIGGVRIESEGALETALGGWSMDSGPLYLEAIFDPDAYQRMTEGIR
jgi:acetolactate synthase-1/2/3 large subunit